MAFYHWSSKRLKVINPMCYLQAPEFKPHGFWFDVDGEWNEWWGENLPDRLSRLRYCHEVTFTDDSRILKLTTSPDLIQFTNRFRHPLYPGQEETFLLQTPGLSPWGSLPIVRYCAINWPEVAKLYDGILITPYNWDCRMELIWYYGFDCASGCVWNTDIIRIHPVRRTKKSGRIPKEKGGYERKAKTLKRRESTIPKLD